MSTPEPPTPANVLRPRNGAKPAGQPSDDAPLFDQRPDTTSPIAPTTFTIHAVLDGFPIDVQFSGKAEALVATIARLRELGATPPDATSAAPHGAESGATPVCKYHGPMKPSKFKEGSWHCTARMADGTYCKEVA